MVKTAVMKKIRKAARARAWRGLVALMFTSVARKDGRWWVVQNDQHPGALSQVARLDHAADHQREAIALVTGLSESEIEVEVRVALDASIAELLVDATTMRAESERLARAASEGFRETARRLSAQQYSMRDIGEILGVSHQRVAQLVKS